MDRTRSCLPVRVGVCAVCLLGVGYAHATEPCGGLDECRVLVEINATDGDIGFHWLADAEGLGATEIRDPSGHSFVPPATGATVICRTVSAVSAPRVTLTVTNSGWPATLLMPFLAWVGRRNLRLEAEGLKVHGRTADPNCLYFEDPDGHRLQVLTPAEWQH